MVRNWNLGFHIALNYNILGLILEEVYYQYEAAEPQAKQSLVNQSVVLAKPP